MSVIMLSVIMLIVMMLSVIMLSVIAPYVVLKGAKLSNVLSIAKPFKLSLF